MAEAESVGCASRPRRLANRHTAPVRDERYGTREAIELLATRHTAPRINEFERAPRRRGREYTLPSLRGRRGAAHLDGTGIPVRECAGTTVCLHALPRPHTGTRACARAEKESLRHARCVTSRRLRHHEQLAEASLTVYCGITNSWLRHH